ncbi:MAG: hypothetical protein VX899_13365 [Myxococcota bacterium]|nr:hypothetical protein [Myxococcota bacterium]
MLLFALLVACDARDTGQGSSHDTVAVDDTGSAETGDTGDAPEVTPGGPSCESPARVTQEQHLDCATGWYAVEDGLYYWPGDCVCSVAGSLALDLSELPEGAVLAGLTQVERLRLTNDAPGALFADLERADGMILQEGTQPRSFPALTDLGWIETLAGSPDTSFPALKSAEGFELRDDATLDFPVLETLGSLRLYSDRPGLSFPSLTSISKELIFSQQTPSDPLHSFPVLVSVDTLQGSGEGTPGSFPALAHLEELDLTTGIGPDPAHELFPALASITMVEATHDASADLGEVLVFKRLTLRDQAVIRAKLDPGASELEILVDDDSRLELDGDTDPEQVITAYGPGELVLRMEELPATLICETELHLSGDALTRAGTLKLEDQAQAELSALQTLGTLELDDDARFTADTLRQAETLEVRTSEPLKLPGLEEIGSLSVERGAVLTATAVTRADSIAVYGDGDLSGLLTLGSGEFTYGSYNLSALQSAQSLDVVDCSTLGSLALLDTIETQSSACALPALTDSVSGGAIELSGKALYTLPDGVSQVVWFKSGSGSVTLENPGAKVLLQGNSTTPTHSVVDSAYVVEVDMYRATSLGTLSDLQSAKRLRYCLPDVPKADVDAWVASVSVSGTVTNTCP